MLNKIRHGFFTFNLTFLLVLNLFFIIVAVLALTAVLCWLGACLGWLDWTRMLNPLAVMILIYIISIIIGISVVVTIQKVILQPVQGMVAAMQRLEQGDFSVRTSCTGWMRPPELRAYTQAFNAAAEELESTELLRKDFINNFSHEFKTPITSMGGFSDLLLEDPDMPPEERQEYLSIIGSESRRLAALANNVLALSRVESQTILTDAAPFDLTEQLRQIVLMMEQKWKKSGVKICSEENPGEDIICKGNESLLKEVWVNLLDNACKFSAQGSTVELRLGEESRNLLVEVTDHGIGMDEKTRRRIFDQFYQGDTSHKTEGNGLGLAMVKKIVALYEGTVAVQTEPGVGSTIPVRLPKN